MPIGFATWPGVVVNEASDRAVRRMAVSRWWPAMLRAGRLLRAVSTIPQNWNCADNWVCRIVPLMALITPTVFTLEIFVSGFAQFG